MSLRSTSAKTRVARQGVCNILKLYLNDTKEQLNDRPNEPPATCCLANVTSSSVTPRMPLSSPSLAERRAAIISEYSAGVLRLIVKSTTCHNCVFSTPLQIGGQAQEGTPLLISAAISQKPSLLVIATRAHRHVHCWDTECHPCELAIELWNYLKGSNSSIRSRLDAA